MVVQLPANWWQGAVDRGLLFPKEVNVFRTMAAED